MKKKTLTISLMLGFMFFLFMWHQYGGPPPEAAPDPVAYATPREADKRSNQPPAQWMSGKWGIGWRFRAGNGDMVKRYKVDRLVTQIQSIPGVSYVLFNLSGGASGDAYTAPHSVLSKITPRACPRRDLFGEMATAFQAAGYKVIAYMATEGPAKLHHGPKDAFDWNGKNAPSVDNWKAWVHENYGSSDVPTLKKAYAEVIVKEFADRYGAKIDGWWFDHASFGNINLIHQVISKANPNAILSFNKGKLGKILNNNPEYEDYTMGHPIPMRHVKADSQDNLPMVTAIEASSNGFIIKNGKPSLGHMFMPMCERWNGGLLVWEEAQAVDWMKRVLRAGGAWTWNIPVDHPRSLLDQKSVGFTKQVAAQLPK